MQASPSNPQRKMTSNSDEDSTMLGLFSHPHSATTQVKIFSCLTTMLNTRKGHQEIVAAFLNRAVRWHRLLTGIPWRMHGLFNVDGSPAVFQMLVSYNDCCYAYIYAKNKQTMECTTFWRASRTPWRLYGDLTCFSSYGPILGNNTSIPRPEARGAASQRKLYPVWIRECPWGGRGWEVGWEKHFKAYFVDSQSVTPRMLIGKAFTVLLL